jgi:hypothetical protein
MASRISIVALVWVLLAAFQVGPADAQCGQTTSVSPRRSFGPGPPPLAVGDSVLYDAAGVLSEYGFASNAMVCRTMAQGIDLLRARQGSLPFLVVAALGTNGAVTSGQIDELLTILGPNRLLALVTPRHGDYAYVPGLMRTVARQRPGRIVVLDWDRLSVGHPDWFAPDGIHLGGTAGIDAFARLVASSLLTSPARLAPATSGSQSTLPPPPPTPSEQRPRLKSASPRRQVPASPAKPTVRTRLTPADRVAWLVVASAEALAISLVSG